MPHASTREELRHWAKEVWEKITGKKEEEVTIKGWVARDSDKHLYFYSVQPQKDEIQWIGGLCFGFYIPRDFDIFDVQWSDEEPTPCEITIKIKK